MEEQIKATILRLSKTTETYKTYDMFLVNENKKAKLNIFNNFYQEELGKDSLVLVKKNGKFYNIIKIEKKQEPKDDEPFQTADEFEDKHNTKLDINMCFKKAIDLSIYENNINEKNIIDNTKKLYKTLQKSKEEIMVR